MNPKHHRKIPEQILLLLHLFNQLIGIDAILLFFLDLLYAIHLWQSLVLNTTFLSSLFRLRQLRCNSELPMVKSFEKNYISKLEIGIIVEKIYLYKLTVIRLNLFSKASLPPSITRQISCLTVDSCKHPCASICVCPDFTFSAITFSESPLTTIFALCVTTNICLFCFILRN